MSTIATVLIVSAVLAFFIGTILPYLRNRLRRRRARVHETLFTNTPGGSVPLVLPPPARPPATSPAAHPAPTPRGRNLRPTPADARRAVVLMTILGPCRGVAPYK